MRVMRFRLKRLAMLCCVLILIFILSAFLVGRHVVKAQMCEDEVSKNVLKTLCHLYEAQQVDGDLCPHLCNGHSWLYVRCLNAKDGKLVIEIKHLNGSSMVVKSKHSYIQDFLLLHAEVYDNSILGKGTEPKTFSDDLEHFNNVIKGTLSDTIGVKEDLLHSALSSLWWPDFSAIISPSSPDYSSHSHRLRVQSAMNSVYSLAQQDEYVIFQVLRDHSVFPRVLGTCGHFYAVELVPPGPYLSPDPSSLTYWRTWPWNKRATIALNFLSLVDYMDNQFAEPLQLCDSKAENFGLTEDLQVKAIDTDMAMFDSKLKETFRETSCSKHEDCDFGDCKGYCETLTMKCVDRRVNNNLQILCEKVLKSSVSNTYAGLLHSPPIDLMRKLSKRLDECSNPGRNKYSDIRYGAERNVLTTLQKLLEKSLWSGNS